MAGAHSIPGLVRIVKLVRFFDELALLMQGIAQSLVTLFWVFVMVRGESAGQFARSYYSGSRYRVQLQQL